MRKKILIAEAADPVRTVAETVLRQHGFEVISVANAERANEVLQYSRPDLIIVSADLCTKDQHPLYEKIQSDPRSTTIPILLLASETGVDVPYPQEVIIPRPLDARELIQRVTTFTGATAPAAKRTSSNPLSAANVDDDFLDEVLGLDRINITESEVLNKTSASIGPASARQPESRHESLVHHEKEAEEMSDSSRVESLMIRDEHAEVDRPKAPSKAAPTGTSKLEIMSDQYGLTDPNAFATQHKDETHDYDWFIRSMSEENQSPTSQSTAKTGGARSSADSGKIMFNDPASTVGPSTPVTSVQPVAPTDAAGQRGQSKSVGVERFIDEFKKEIERLRSSEPEDLEVGAKASDASRSKGQMAWEDVVEKTTPEQVELFTKQLASELADKLAVLIASKIDADKLLHLIKNELMARSSGTKRP
jgi:CheY-like chemotaxis protein